MTHPEFLSYLGGGYTQWWWKWGKKMTKIYVQRNSDRDLLDNYNFCEEGIMCEVQDLKEELGSARLQAEGIRCVWEATVI